MINDILLKDGAFYKSCELGFFFTLPNGKMMAGYSWGNDKDEIIDCNIHHPKYGKQYEGNMFSSQHYTDPQGKKITCIINACSILCQHKDGTFTNKDGIQIFKKELWFDQRKTPETDDDFQAIVERELKENNLQNTPESKRFLPSILIPEIDRLIQLHKENRNYGKGLDAPLVQVAERFKEWLNKKHQTEDASHREIVIAYNFKVKAGLEKEKTPAQWKEERGERARQAYYTTLKQSENYKAPTKKELQKVIELLKEVPQVQKMAINELEALQSL